MGLRIGTNVAAMTALRHLKLSTKRVNRSLERLSSGLRINRAADDAAGLAISLRLRSQIRLLQQAERNAQDGISATRIADGALSEVGNLLVRMRELAQQAATETLSETERDYLHGEFDQLRREIDRIAGSSHFTHLHLLDGSAGTVGILVGAGTDEDSFLDLDLDDDLDSDAIGLGGLSLAGSDGSNAIAAIDGIKTATDIVLRERAELGATENVLESRIRNLHDQVANLSAAKSRILDVDYAAEMAELTSAQIIQQAGIAVLAQAINAPALALRLLDTLGRR